MRPFDTTPFIEQATQLLDVLRPGQLVTSDVGATLLDAELPTPLSTTDLGWHRLRDLGPPIRLWRVASPGAEHERPEVRSLEAFRHNLPIVHTSLVGRDEELRVLGSLLAEASCVTLTGSGGIGKSRLAMALGAGNIDRYPGGVWWVELASSSDHESVTSAVRGVLEHGSTERRGSGEHSVEAPTLLVLDNCEHVAHASALLVAELLDADPLLRVLATSREPLGVSGERVWRVPSLAIPPRRSDLDIAALRSCSSLRLFTERARAHDRTFELDESNATSVAQICARLDGIPLAIELAAARCRQLGPGRVLTELDHRFELLTQAPRNEHRRHQTLSASIDWSHDLLDREERIVFRRLGVFSGPFTLDLASDVVVALGQITRARAIDCISRLVDCSLVDSIRGRHEPRHYRLLETLRVYAADRAVDAGELDLLRDAQVDWWLSWFDRPSQVPDGDALATVESMTENLRASVEWSSSEPRRGLTLLAHAARAWQGTTHGVDAVLAADRVLTSHNAAAAPDVWLDAAVAMSVHYAFVRGGEATSELVRRTREVADRLGDPFAVAAARWIERSDVESSATMRELARAREDEYLEALTAVTAAEHLAEREPLLALSVLDDDTVIATCGSEYLASWSDLVRGRIARDVGDFTTCLALGHRLIADRSAHMVFNGMILLVQAGLLTGSRDALTAAVGAATSPSATPRMVAEAHVARTHLAYLDKQAASRVDPEFGREPMTPGSLWLCALEAIDAGDAELAERVVAAAGPDGPLLDAVRSAVRAAAGDVERWFESLSMARMLGLQPLVVECLEGVAVHRASVGSWVDCLRLLAAAERRRDELGYHWRFPRRQAEVEAALVASEAGLPHSDAAAATADGGGMTSEAAAAFALRGHGRRGRPRLGWESLTPTELHVAEAVANGLTNRRIGDLMMISPTTVKSHLDHIFTKLGVHSRTEVAADYVRRTASA